MKTVEKNINQIQNKPKIRCVGNLYPSKGQAGNIYDPNCICPCITGCADGGGKEIKIIISIDERNDIN